MEFGFTKREQDFREEVISFLDKALTAQVRKDFESWAWGRVPDVGITPALHEFNLKLGEKGLLGISWPTEYGGREGSFTEEFILIEELARRRAVIPNYTAVFMVGPSILRYGNEEQKARFLPSIARGEIEFALGYTEPQAGSDLASLEIYAQDMGDYFVINGQKTFNTACHCADYHWLAARTDRSVPKHKGISLFMVDLHSPGITIRSLKTIADGRTNEVFYDNVEIPKSNMLGEMNRGFQYLITALDFERSTLFSTAELIPLLEEIIRYVKESRQDGDKVIRQNLAQMTIEIEAGRLLSYRVMWMIDQGYRFSYESAMAKMYNTEAWQRMVKVAINILKLYAQLLPDSAYTKFNGIIERGHFGAIMPTFGAGSNELMRNIIATRGLGLPLA